MSNLFWEIGRLVHLVHMPMWPRSDGAEQCSPSLDEPYSPLCSRSHLASLSFLPGLLAPVGFWVFDPAPAPSFLGPLISTTPAQQKTSLWCEKGLPTGCATGLACPWFQAFAQAVPPAWNSFPQISAQGARYAAGRAWGTECEVLQKNAAFYSMQWCHTLSKLNVVGLLQGNLTSERKLNIWGWNLPDREGYLHARKIQGESDWGLEHLVLDH